MFISVAAFAQTGQQKSTECEYQLSFGDHQFKLCDSYDTVPMYDAQGEIIGDTAIFNSIRGLEDRVSTASLQSVADVRINSIADPARPIGVNGIKLIVIRQGKTESFGLTNSKLSDAQQQLLRSLQRGDTVRITGGAFTDGGKKVNIPFAIRLDVR